MADFKARARSSSSLEEAVQISEADSCRPTTKHHLAKSSMAGPVFVIVDITDAAIFKLEHEERHVAGGSMSSIALPTAITI
jgi:hypothetical protein